MEKNNFVHRSNNYVFIKIVYLSKNSEGKNSNNLIGNYLEINKLKKGYGGLSGYTKHSANGKDSKGQFSLH